MYFSVQIVGLSIFIYFLNELTLSSPRHIPYAPSFRVHYGVIGVWLASRLLYLCFMFVCLIY